MRLYFIWVGIAWEEEVILALHSVLRPRFIGAWNIIQVRFNHVAEIWGEIRRCEIDL
jgi:hypothetical protein